jgi:hypothetical protein
VLFESDRDQYPRKSSLMILSWNIPSSLAVLTIALTIARFSLYMFSGLFPDP